MHLHGSSTTFYIVTLTIASCKACQQTWLAHSFHQAHTMFRWSLACHTEMVVSSTYKNYLPPVA